MTLASRKGLSAVKYIIYWQSIKCITFFLNLLYTCQKFQSSNNNLKNQTNKKTKQKNTKNKIKKKSVEKIYKNVPTPGIEPGPPGWKPGILTTRPYGSDRWVVPVSYSILTTQNCFHMKYRIFKFHAIYSWYRWMSLNLRQPK